MRIRGVVDTPDAVARVLHGPRAAAPPPPGPHALGDAIGIVRASGWANRHRVSFLTNLSLAVSRAAARHRHRQHTHMHGDTIAGMSRSSIWMLALLPACDRQPQPETEAAERKLIIPVSSPVREVCREPRRACAGFADTNPADPALGADIGAAAADALHCGDIVKGHATRCPNNRDSRTQAYLCPEYARGPEFPGQQVMCGPCRSSRAEMLAFGIKALLDTETLDALSKCASAGRCGAWLQCEEAVTGQMKAGDWTADFFGWSLDPARALIPLDPPADSAVRGACRPHDAATWPEAVTFFARLSGLSDGLRCSSLDIGTAATELTPVLARGCRLRGVEDGDRPYIAAAVALNNAGVYCLTELPNGRRTANICGTDDITACSPTRYVMSTIVARLRGDIELAACIPIDTADLDCGHGSP